MVIMLIQVLIRIQLLATQHLKFASLFILILYNDYLAIEDVNEASAILIKMLIHKPQMADCRCRLGLTRSGPPLV
jgi:hypothetical protein